MRKVNIHRLLSSQVSSPRLRPPEALSQKDPFRSEGWDKEDLSGLALQLPLAPFVQCSNRSPVKGGLLG